MYSVVIRGGPSHGLTEHFVKFERVAFELCEQTDRQTHRQT